LALALTVGTAWAAQGTAQTALTRRYVPRLLLLERFQEEADALPASLPFFPVLTVLYRPFLDGTVRYAQVSGFRANWAERYLRYGEDCPDLSPEEVVARVNIGLDQSFYSGVIAISDPGAATVLVNKYRCLGSDFVPELVKMSSQYASRSAYMEPTAYEWFTKMADDARAEGLRLYSVSAYRSYDYQVKLYQNYVRRSGQESADTYSARPGFSEHQTGLVVDINTASRSAHFERTAQYRWLLENSWKYGFILRYPEGKEEITGYIFEPWHFRFVGLETAQAVYESGLTYDEYVALQPADAE
jgi:D-alanyl-D-alanine carboxypeptidase